MRIKGEEYVLTKKRGIIDFFTELLTGMKENVPKVVA